ncbi:hypothetical protein HQ545_02955 [Candidatus Woesearchaeota archaeon]|nr:hypothetical protein [Candidatus Woesearchaeota archaeon]
MKIKRYTKSLTAEDCIDITLYFEENSIIKFALNYRARIKGSWKEVYRVDNFHGFLHEQRFWISPKPIRIENFTPLKFTIKEYTDNIIRNHQIYRQSIEKKWE